MRVGLISVKMTSTGIRIYWRTLNLIYENVKGSFLPLSLAHDMSG